MSIKEILLLLMTAILTACSANPGQNSDGAVSGGASEIEQTPPAVSVPATVEDSSVTEQTSGMQTGIIKDQILNGADGEIHYSYYLPESYDGTRKFPMMVILPGYDGMWFGEDSIDVTTWSGFRAWTKLDEDMVVVTAQLTDWHEKSARQSIELTEYFLESYSVDPDRVYAAGYSAGGETMSQAVSMRPELYAAYHHGASQWDGTFDPVAENGVAVYIFMAENDEYYGSQKARSAYSGLHDAYIILGWTEEQIGQVLRVEIPDNKYFNDRGIYGNYHGGGNALFNDETILNWIVSHRK